MNCLDLISIGEKLKKFGVSLPSLSLGSGQNEYVAKYPCGCEVTLQHTGKAKDRIVSQVKCLVHGEA